MDCLGRDFLARAAFPLDQYRRLARSYLTNQLKNALHGGRTPDHPVWSATVDYLPA